MSAVPDPDPAVPLVAWDLTAKDRQFLRAMHIPECPHVYTVRGTPEAGSPVRCLVCGATLRTEA